MDKDRVVADVEYDSDDMSAGARLMRYYVSDEPRPDLVVQTSTRTTTNDSRLSANRDLKATDLLNPNAIPEGDTNPSSPLPHNHTHESHDDRTIAANLEDLKGDLLYDVAGRHSHRGLLTKVQKFHPLADFTSKELTLRLVQAIKSRASRYGVSQGEVRDELDDTREANGVASTKNYRVRNRKKLKGQEGQKEIGEVSTQSNGNDRAAS